MANDNFALAELQTTQTLDGSDLLYVSQGGASKAVAFEDMIKSVVVGENQQLFFNNDGEMGACENVKYSPKGNILTIGTPNIGNVPLSLRSYPGLNGGSGITTIYPLMQFVEASNGKGYTVSLANAASNPRLRFAANFDGSSGAGFEFVHASSIGTLLNLDYTAAIWRDGFTHAPPSGSTIGLTFTAGLNCNAATSHLRLYGGDAWSITNISGSNCYIRGGKKAGSGVDGQLYLGYDGTTVVGNVILCTVSLPADSALAANQLALWFDATDGAGKLMIKAKTANGTVVTGSVTLS